MEGSYSHGEVNPQLNFRLALSWKEEALWFSHNSHQQVSLPQRQFRDELRECLSLNGIDTAIHYPIPIHLQPASKKLGYQAGDFPITERQSKEILTLPVNQYMTEEEIDKIIAVINEFEPKAIKSINLKI